MTRAFASDNNAGVHPEVLAAIAAVNVGHERAYGDDPHTARALAKLRQTFGDDVQAFFVFNGTGGNVLGLKAVTEPYHAVICAASAHIYADECGAPERFTGCKLLPLDTPAGKLTPAGVEPLLTGLGDPHHSQPKVVSITQATELGTVYTPAEIGELAELCRARSLYLHMDGARLFNAAASLGVSLARVTREAGVDVLTLGGTKNGILGGEVVLFMNRARAPAFPFIRKQGMQLSSKMRFVAAQFEALLDDELWRRSAEHANRMARRLGDGLRALSAVRLPYPVEANAVFAYFPDAVVEQLQQVAYFYPWEPFARDGLRLVRLMASFDTTEEDVDRFVAAARRLLA